MIEEFNVDSKAECDQLDQHTKIKQTNASARLVQYTGSTSVKAVEKEWED